MDCPICVTEAMDLTPPSYDGLVIGCPKCGKYRIMRSVLTDLRHTEIEDRVAALGCAISYSSKSWPTISRACLPEVRAQERTGRQRSAPQSLSKVRPYMGAGRPTRRT